MDDEEMDIDMLPAPSQAFYSWIHGPQGSDVVRWEPSQPTSSAVAMLLSEAAASRPVSRGTFSSGLPCIFVFTLKKGPGHQLHCFMSIPLTFFRLPLPSRRRLRDRSLSLSLARDHA